MSALLWAASSLACLVIALSGWSLSVRLKYRQGKPLVLWMLLISLLVMAIVMVPRLEQTLDHIGYSGLGTLIGHSAGITMLWSISELLRSSQDTTELAGKFRLRFAVLCTVLVVLWSLVLAAMPLPEASWPLWSTASPFVAAYWALICTYVGVLAVDLVIRGTIMSRLESDPIVRVSLRLFAFAGLMSLVAIATNLSVILNASYVSDVWFQLVWHLDFLVVLGATALALSWGQIANLSLIRARRDKRYCQLIHPLWRLTTGNVPETVLPFSDSNPSARLVRMLVEINDSIAVMGTRSPGILWQSCEQLGREKTANKLRADAMAVALWCGLADLVEADQAAAGPCLEDLGGRMAQAWFFSQASQLLESPEVVSMSRSMQYDA